MEPTHTVLEDRLPIKATRLEQRGGFVRTVVEHHRGTHAFALIAPHLSHIGAVHTIVFKAAVEGVDAHLADLGLDFSTDRVVYHR